jgi:hypothetical protein
MALSPEEKDDIVLLFLEGMDLYGLNTADSLDRILSLQALTREEVLSFLQSDQWLMADGQTAVVWEEDRPETSHILRIGSGMFPSWSRKRALVAKL